MNQKINIGDKVSVRRRARVFILFFLSLIIFPFTSPVVKASNSNLHDAQAVVYLEVPESISDFVRLEFSGAKMFGQSAEFPLELRYFSISSDEFAGRQILLGEVSLPSGDYRHLKLFLKSIVITIDGEKSEVGIDSSGVDIRLNLHIDHNSAEAIFIVWNPGEDRPVGAHYRPMFHLRVPAIPPVGSMAFITNEKSGNISLVDRFSYRVVDVLKADSGPRGMAYSRLTQQLYVANSGSDNISVIDISNRQVLRNIELPFGDRPSRLALSPGEDNLYVLNEGSNSLSVIDTRTYQEINRVSLGFSPIGLGADKLSGYVYIGNSLSNNITVYEPARQEIASEMSISGSPREVLIDERNRMLYFSYERQRTLSGIDLTTGNFTVNMNLCSPVTGLAFNRSSRLLYVSLGECSEIGILKPENELNLGRIALPSSPGLLTIDPEARQLMAVLPDSNCVAAVNIINKRLDALIEVGDQPYQVLVAE